MEPSKTIVINWKWVGLSESGAVEAWSCDQGEFRVICLNYEREEAFFEDEIPELYAPENERVLGLLNEDLGRGDALFFFHKNPPHYGSNFDVEWWEAQGVKAVLFGGGEDPIYAFARPFGILDQVGGFDSGAVSEAAGRQLSNRHLHELWAAYCGEEAGLNEELMRFSRELTPYLLSLNDQAIPGHLSTQAASLAKKEGISKNLLAALKKIMLGDKSINAMQFNQEIERILHAS